MNSTLRTSRNLWISRQRGYKKAGEARVTSSGDLTGIHDKFATVFAAGCLAIREGILPFKEKELMEAILTCEEDHVRFVDEELGGTFQPQLPPIDVLRAYIQKNRQTFIDLNKQRLPLNHNHKTCPGYIIKRPNGQPAYLFSEQKLQEITPRPGAADELKQELHDEKLILRVAAEGGKYRFSTKRTIGRKRESVVEISGDICEVSY